MIKFRGMMQECAEYVHAVKPFVFKVESCDKNGRENEFSQEFDVIEDTLEINVSGHWLSIPDLEAIVEKVMGGKNDC